MTNNIPIYHDTKEKIVIPIERCGFRPRLLVFAIVFCSIVALYMLSFIHDTSYGLEYEDFSVGIVGGFFQTIENFILTMDLPNLVNRVASGLTTLFSIEIVAALSMAVVWGMLASLSYAIIYSIVKTLKIKEHIKTNIILE